MRFPYQCLRASVVAGLLAAGAIVAANCGTPMTSPGSTPTPTPTPAPPPANPPKITAMAASTARVDANGQITLTATVEDPDTPVDQLVYAWTATPAHGTFSGSGRSVTWTAPAGVVTPDIYSFTVTVSENQPLHNTVTSAPVQVRYNDSKAEIGALGVRFLTVLFPDFSVTPSQAVQDFSDTCPGKAAEFSDVVQNRANFRILSGAFSVSSFSPIVVQPGLPAKDSLYEPDFRGTCTFQDIPNGGQQETVTGVCCMSAIYENWKWFLCDSNFGPTCQTKPASAGTLRGPDRVGSMGRTPLPSIKKR